LKVKDVQDQRGNIRDSLEFTEQKTGKNRDIELNQEVKEALQYFFKKTGVFDLEEFIFRDSRNIKNRENKPISRIRAYQVINKYARQAGVQTKVGTHTLRKIFGTHARKQGIPIELVSEALGHRNIEVTKRYLGITNDEVKKAFKNFKI
jgi:site-specific recombinase XerD